jgi:branched-chain amino acid transport system substrate-binding protein
MKRSIAAALAVAVAFGVMIAGSVGVSSGATTKKKKKINCTTNIAIMSPDTGVAATLGLEQLHFAEFAVAHFNKVLGIHVHYAVDDTQLPVVAVAVQRADAVAASNAVAVVGPAGSNEVEAVMPILGRYGIPAISGSATRTSLTTSGKYPTFFRVVAYDAIQGPQDAHYIINHLHPHHILIIDDEEAYSQGLVSVMVPIWQAAGISVDHQSYNGADSGTTLSNDLGALVNAHVSNGDVVVVPWQSAANAEVLGNIIAQDNKRATLFGTDGTDAPGVFDIPGAYVSNFGPDISTSANPLDKAIAQGVTKYGPYGSFGVPTYEATHVIMKAIANVCAAGHKPTRGNVMAQVRKTYVAASQNAFGVPIKFNRQGDIVGGGFYLFHVNANKQYIQIPAK